MQSKMAKAIAVIVAFTGVSFVKGNCTSSCSEESPSLQWQLKTRDNFEIFRGSACEWSVLDFVFTATGGEVYPEGKERHIYVNFPIVTFLPGDEENYCLKAGAGKTLTLLGVCAASTCGGDSGKAPLSSSVLLVILAGILGVLCNWASLQSDSSMPGGRF